MGFPDGSGGKESACNAGDPSSIPGSGRSSGGGIGGPLQYSWAFLVAQLVKNPPAIRETWLQSLGWEEPLEKGKAGYPLQYSGLENSMDRTVPATFTFILSLDWLLLDKSCLSGLGSRSWRNCAGSWCGGQSSMVCGLGMAGHPRPRPLCGPWGQPGGGLGDPSASREVPPGPCPGVSGLPPAHAAVPTARPSVRAGSLCPAPLPRPWHTSSPLLATLPGSFRGGDSGLTPLLAVVGTSPHRVSWSSF